MKKAVSIFDSYTSLFKKSNYKEYFKHYIEAGLENIEIEIKCLKGDIERQLYSKGVLEIKAGKLEELEKIRINKINKIRIKNKFTFKIFGFVITKA